MVCHPHSWYHCYCLRRRRICSISANISARPPSSSVHKVKDGGIRVFQNVCTIKQHTRCLIPQLMTFGNEGTGTPPYAVSDLTKI